VQRRAARRLLLLLLRAATLRRPRRPPHTRTRVGRGALLLLLTNGHPSAAMKYSPALSATTSSTVVTVDWLMAVTSTSGVNVILVPAAVGDAGAAGVGVGRAFRSERLETADPTTTAPAHTTCLTHPAAAR
jgi:hypothetical protein